MANEVEAQDRKDKIAALVARVNAHYEKLNEDNADG
jgi:hypothetical protein